MKRRLLSLTAVFAAAVMAVSLTGCNSEQPKAPQGNIKEVTLEEGDVFAVIHVRDYGDITLKLFPQLAPKAVERFMTLSLRGYYDGRTFHRVIDDLMIQGGSFTGNGYDGEVAEEEFFPVEVSENARHFYGALCFAKSGKGNYCQFYIVNNNEPQDIAAIAEKIRSQLDDPEIADRMLDKDKAFYEEYYAKLMAIPDEVKEKYLSAGGDFQLDGDYTVFGQTIDGFDVLEKISSVEVVSGNIVDDRSGISSKPLNDIIIDSVDIIRIAGQEDEKAKTSKMTRATTPPEETTAEDLSEQTTDTEAPADTASADPEATEESAAGTDVETESTEVGTTDEETISTEETSAQA